MNTHDNIDTAFLASLVDFAGSTEEFEFERRGTGDSTYSLHGQVVAVNPQSSTIQIRRTRTHAGELHEMGLQYFLSATRINGVKLFNRMAHERNRQFLAKQEARVVAVARAAEDPTYRPSGTTLYSTFVGQTQRTLEGYSTERYVYQDRENSNRRVGIIAKSFYDAEHFMSRQDIFMPLDDMVLNAVSGRILWPAGMAFDRQKNAGAWSANWFHIYDELAGIAPAVLGYYLQRVHSRYASLSAHSLETLKPREVQLLIDRGLLRYEAPPQTLDETLDRISMSGLRQFLRDAGSRIKSAKRETLQQEVRLLLQFTPALTEATKQFMRPPKLLLWGPAGLTVEAFDCAVRELRDSIFLMRQWLRATRELYREDELAQLVDVV